MENWKTTLAKFHRSMYRAYRDVGRADATPLCGELRIRREVFLDTALSRAKEARDILVDSGLVPSKEEAHHYREFAHARPQHEEARSLIRVILRRQRQDLKAVTVRNALLREITGLEKRLAEANEKLRRLEPWEPVALNKED